MVNWSIKSGKVSDIILINTRVINTGEFSNWLSSRGISVKKMWAELPNYAFKVSHGKVTEHMMRTKWGDPGLPPPPPPAPAPEKDILVQYESPDDEKEAKDLAEFLDADLVFTPEGYEEYPEFSREPPYSKLVVVGGQEANSLFAELVGEGIFRKITPDDEGYIFIQHGFWDPYEVWGVAGWTYKDTVRSKMRVQSMGLPKVTVHEKYEVVGPPEVSEPTKRWRAFRENPSVASALGTLPDTTLNAFSRVFSGWDIFEEREIAPEPGHYVTVGLILGGIALASVAAIYAAISAASGISVAGLSGKFVTVSRTTYANKILTPAAKAATEGKAIQYLVTNEGVITTSVAGLPGKAILLFQQLAAMPLRWKLFAALSGAFLLTQLDATGWFFGLSPEASHRKAETLLKSVRADMIRLDELVENKDWSHARELADTIKVQLSEIRRIMDAYPKQFWEKFGFSFTDKDAMLTSMVTNFESYLDQYPQLTTIVPLFPEEIVLENVKVIDGDSVEYPGHPEVQNEIRFVGIDAHESGTDAGKEEAEYLRTLIEGKTVTFKVDPHAENQIGLYGRLLAVPFVDGENVVIKMLDYFGKDILTATRYQKKHKYVDWDELKRHAKEATGPGVREFKIRIDSSPSRAKLYIDDVYTHHLTPSDEKELKDVMDMLTPGSHKITVKKGGKEAEAVVNIVAGYNPDIFLKLVTVGIPSEEVEKVTPKAPPEVAVEEPEEFKINIISTPLRAKLYIDGIYTHHLTPSNEKELKDVMHLLTPGKHTIRLTKGGKAAEKEVDIVAGANPDVFMKLEVVGLPKSREELEKKIAETRELLEKLEAELAALG